MPSVSVKGTVNHFTSLISSVPKKYKVVLVFLFTLLTGTVTIYHLLFLDKIYPGVKVANFNLSGLTKEQAEEKLAETFKEPNVFLQDSKNQEFSFTPEELGIKYNMSSSAQAAYNIGRHSAIIDNQRKKLHSLIKTTNLPLSLNIDELVFEKTITSLHNKLFIPGINPSVSLEGGRIKIGPGENGQEVDTEKLKEEIIETLAFAKEPVLTIPIRTISLKLTEQETQKLNKRATNILGKTIKLHAGDERFVFSEKELLTLLTPEGSNQEKISTLVKNISEKTDRKAENARFVFKKGRVKEFAPAKKGVSIEKEKLTRSIKTALESLIKTEEKEISIQAPLSITEPLISTEETNELGIKELIGRGSSKFRGSTKERVHNIQLAASKLNGLLIEPGKTFSFNQALGDISIYSGYQQAYIIKDGKTVLGDGGGVCQVSTTFFRAALNSGLPIITRNPHSYRVSYYEQDSKPGIDATVYSPSVDLVIKNDTPTYILIQAKTNTYNKTLDFEFYGSKDGRVAEISTPKVWDITPAPPPLYQDDPTLPVGVEKQIDFEATGAKVSFQYKVTRNGKILQDRTFYSNYRPWQAVFLRGTAQ